MFEAENLNHAVPSDVLLHYRGRGKEAVYVSLQGYEIKDLVPLVSQLAELQYMSSLNLSHNQLEYLPQDLSSLKRLESLDLRFNPIRDAYAVLTGLNSLPMLKHLKIHLPTEADEDEVIAQLANLDTFNGVALRSEAEMGYVPPQPMSAAESFLQALRDDVDQRLHNMQGYEQVPPPTIDPAATFTPWTQEDIDRYQAVYNAVSRVSGRISHPQEYDDFSTLVTKHLRARLKPEPDLFRRQAHQFNASSLLLEYSFDELLRATSERYPADMTNALHSLMNEHLRLMGFASKLIAAVQEDRDRKIAALQNDLARELLLKERSRLRSVTAAVPETDSILTQGDIDALEHEYKRNHTIEGVLPLKELHTMMERLMETKVHADESNESCRLPKETLEQHVYSYYFSRCKTDEDLRIRVSSVYNSIKHFAGEDLDVEVFGLILRNDLEEGYWKTHLALTENLYDAMHSTLLAQGTERQGDLRDLDGRLDEETCRTVVNLVYPGRDNGVLLRKITNAMIRGGIAKQTGYGATGNRGQDSNALTIGYKEFVQTVLRFHLASALNNVQHISNEFRALDPEHSGVLDLPKFRTLVGNLYPGISSTKVGELVAAVDPVGHNIVRYTDVVQALKKIERKRLPAPPQHQQGSVVPSPAASVVGVSHASGLEPIRGNTVSAGE